MEKLKVGGGRRRGKVIDKEGKRLLTINVDKEGKRLLTINVSGGGSVQVPMLHLAFTNQHSIRVGCQ